jgi:polyisoprenoid-binding protein YceI
VVTNPFVCAAPLAAQVGSSCVPSGSTVPQTYEFDPPHWSTQFQVVSNPAIIYASASSLL